MTSHGERAAFTTDDEWTPAQWRRALAAMAARAQHEAAASGPLPGDMIRFRRGALLRLAHLDGDLVALPVSEHETYFALTAAGAVECTAFVECGHGHILDPAQARPTGEISVQYTSFEVGPGLLDVRFFWMPARVWSVDRDLHHGDTPTGRTRSHPC
ncbi:hypothetical protein DFR70_12648 [Nocardia tenerifensis]|uniref:Uncharacterized protein n=1 Tax=Nocardia tenerifensis TaxID=228006 RepID=A0A318JNZ8_9NOCA|nr:hypothetical protein [Nocardia tenerifensis]PXX53927.1 hypothetical protein DFR70_12648 [Nocardia tenerifensis]